MLAQVTWDGGAGTLNYFDIANWDTNELPKSEDSVVIPDLEGTPTIILGASTSVKSISSQESVTIASATLTLSETSEFSGALTLTNSILAGSGTVSVSGLTSLFNSNIDGAGVFNAQGGMQFIAGPASAITSRTLNVSGATTASTLVIFYNGATVNLLSGAQWDLQNNVSLGLGSGAMSTFNNAGTLRKPSGTGTSTIGLPFNNTGTVQVDSGTLNLSQGGTGSGSFSIAADASLTASQYDFTTSSSISGAGSILLGSSNVRGTYNIGGSSSFAGGTTTFYSSSNVVNIGSSLSLSSSTLDLSSGEAINTGSISINSAVLTGTDTITASGLTSLFNSNIDGAGVFNAQGGMQFIAGPTSAITSRTLNVSGTTTASTLVMFYNGATVNLLSGAQWELQNNVSLGLGSGAMSTFNNAGTLRKSSGTGTSIIGLPFNNTGTVQVDSGTLNLSQGGTGSGSFSIAADASLTASQYDFTISSSISGAGSILLGSSNVRGTYNIGGNSSFAGGTTTFYSSSNVVNIGSSLSLSSSTLDLSSGEAINTGSISINSAVLTGTDTITASGLTSLFNSNIDGAGVFNAQGGMQFIAGPTSAITSRTLNVSGTTTASTLVIFYNGATVNLLSGAQWDLESNVSLGLGSGAMSTFNNAGTLRKPSGTGTSTIGLPFNNTGSVQVNSGTLNLSQGGTGSGSFSIAADASLTASQYDFTTSSSISGAGSILLGSSNVRGTYNIGGSSSFAGGTTTFYSSSNVVNIGSSLSLSSSTLDLSSGEAINTGSISINSAILTGTDTVNASGLTSLFNSNIDGAGVFNAQGGMQFIAGPASAITSRTLNVSGATTASTLVMFYNGATVNLLSGAQWDLQNNVSLGLGSGAMSTFNNAGTLRKPSGTGTSTIGLPFNNTGSVQVNSGTLNLSQGGTGSGSFSIAADASLTASQYDFATSSSISGAGSILLGSSNVRGTYNIGGSSSFAGGTTTFYSSSNVVNIGSSLSLSSSTLDLSSGEAINTGSISINSAVLTGTDTITASGLTSLFNSNIDGAGVFNAQGGMQFIAGPASAITSRTLNVSGATTASTLVIFYNGATVNLLSGAQWDLQNNVSLGLGSGAMSTFNNAGTLRKPSGTGTSTIGLPFNNTGSVQVNSGTLNLSQGGTGSGSFSIAADASLTASQYDFTTSSSISGAGSILLGSSNVRGTYNIGGSSSFAGGTTTFYSSSNVVNIGSSLSLNSSTLDLSSGEAINTGSISINSAVLTGTDTVTASGLTSLFNSNIDGAGVFNAQGGMQFIAGPASAITSRTLNVSGATTASTLVMFYNGATVNLLSGAQWDLESNVSLGLGSGAMSTFNNAGTLRKPSGTGTSTIGLPFNNTGTVQVDSGTLNLSQGGTGSGSFSIAADASLTASQYDFTISSSISGAGSILLGSSNVRGTYNIGGNSSFAGGTTTFYSSSNVVNIGSSLSLSSSTLDLSSGEAINTGSISINSAVLTGTDTITASGLTSLFNSNLDGVGVFNAQGGMQFIAGPASAITSRTLNVSGATTASTLVMFYNGATVNLLSGAQWDLESNVSLGLGSGAMSIFNNAGTLRKPSGTGTSTIGLPFNNTGTVQVDSGTLNLSQGGTGSGSFSIAADASLTASQYDFTTSSSISGAGSILLGSSNVRGTYNIGGSSSFAGGTTTFYSSSNVVNIGSSLSLNSSTLDLSSGEAINTGSISINSAVLTGTDTITASGLTSLFNSNLDGVGVFNAQGGMQFIAGPASAITSRTLNVSGATTASTLVMFYNGATVNLLSGAQWDLESNVSLGLGSGAMSIFNNAGTLRKPSGTGTSTIGLPFNNTGSVQVNSGTLNLSQGGTGSGSFSIAADASLTASQYDFTTSSSISGAGSILLGSSNVRGTYNIGGSSSFAGGTTTFYSSSNVVNIGSSLSLNSSTLDLSSGEAINTGSISINSAVLTGTDTVTASGLTSLFNSNIDGAGVFNAQGGMQFIAGPTSAITSRTLNVSGATTASTLVMFYNGATVNLLSGAQWDLENNVSLGLGSGAMSTFNNAGTLRKPSGTGTSTIGLPFNNTGIIRVDAGTLSLTSNLVQYTSNFLTGGEYIVGNGASLTLPSGNIILVNQAKVTLVGTGSFDNLSGLTTNQGTLVLDTGSLFQPATNVSDSGILVVNGTFSPISLEVVAGGTLKGAGFINAPVSAQSESVVTPGNSPGILNTGNFNLASGASFEVEIGGAAPGNTAGNHDQLVVNGTVTLAGTLNASFVGNFLPSNATTFIIIDNDATEEVIGTFAGLAEGAPLLVGNKVFTISYRGGTGNDVVLTSGGTRFTVTTTSDTGVGSLRQAIVDANSNPGSDLIAFNIPGLGVKTINVLSSALPTITDPVIIDGYTQPGTSVNTLSEGDNAKLLIELNGTAVQSAGASGISLNTSNSTVKGLVINRFSVGITSTGSNNTIVGNFIGTNPTGTSRLGNLQHGITIAGTTNNRVGGSAIADRNLISGNGINGVNLTGTGNSGNVIAGNYIGTDVNGQSLPTGAVGFWKGENNAIGEVGGVNGTLNNGVTFASGVAGQALSFDGLDDSISIPGSASFAPTTLAIEGWIQQTDGSQSANPWGVQAIVAKWFDTSDKGFLLQTVNGRLSLGIVTSAGRTDLYSPTTLPTNTWVHVAATYDGHDMRLFENGVLVASQAKSGGIVTSTNIVSIGNIGTTFGFKGRIDELAIYNYALNASAIQFIYNRGSQGKPNDLGNIGDGVSISNGASSNTIGGTTIAHRNVINGNNGDGIEVNGPTSLSNVISGNYIGTDPTGNVAMGNSVAGVRVTNETDSNTIGGSDSGAGNVISGNLTNGIFLNGSGTTFNTVVGNKIGTNAAGTAAVANGSVGVRIQVSTTNNTVGGNDSSARNVISGNFDHGVFVGDNSSRNSILGNYVGTNASGTAAIPNLNNGIQISTGTLNAIGNGVGGRNVISGNFGRGIILGSTANTTVAGNYIGTTADGMTALGNEWQGILVGGTTGNVIGTNGDGINDNTEGNLISGNSNVLGFAGLQVNTAANSSNVVAGNIIGLNATQTAALGNGNNSFNGGIAISGGATLTRIGTNNDGISDDLERNVISGNRGYGILLSDSGTSSNVIAGNFIGTNTLGASGLGNRTNGIHVLSGASKNKIGGFTPASRNIISGNLGSGIFIQDSTSSENMVLNNYIGTGLTGSSSLPNRSNGVDLRSGAKDTVVGVVGSPLIVSDWGNSRIKQFLPSTTIIDQNAPSSLNPLGIAVASDGSRFVISQNGTLWRFGTDGLLLNTLATGLGDTRNVTIGPNGDIFVASHSTNTIYRFSGANYSYLGTFVTGLNGPVGLNFGPDGNLYVSETDFGGNGRLLKFHGTTGSLLGQVGNVNLRWASSPVWDAAGNIYLTERNGNTLLKLNGTTGALIQTLASGGILSGPEFLAFGPDGLLYVSAIFSNSVQKYDPQTGAFIGYAIAPSVGLNLPHGIAFGPNVSAGNVISGNLGFGVSVNNSTVNAELLRGNLVGIAANGTTILSNVNGGHNLVNGAILKGSGTLTGNVSNQANINPGNSPGIITINGNYAQASTGALNIELQGTNPSTPDFDQLIVNGTVTLAGALNLNFLNSYVPSISSTFKIIDNDSSDAVVGTFNGLSEGASVLVGGTSFRISYRGGTGNDVVLTAGITTYTVTTTGDSGGGSLRQAILDANAHAGPDVIAFNIPGSGVRTIAPTSALPAITDTVTISGNTQPGWNSTPIIELRGDLAGANANGLTLTGSNSLIQGLVINRFAGSGIHIAGSGATGNRVVSNYIGTNAAGSIALANGNGISLTNGAFNNSIGGFSDLLVASYPDGLARYTVAGQLIEPFASTSFGNFYDFVQSSNGDILGSYRSGKIVRFTSDGDLIGLFASSANDLAGLLIAPDGSLLASSYYGNAILRFDGQTGAFLGTLTTAVNGPGEMKIGPDGSLFVAMAGGVKRFNVVTGADLGFFTSGISLGDLGGFDFGSDGKFYLADYRQSRVLRFDISTGVFLDVFATGTPVLEISDLDYTSHGDVYVTSYRDHSVSRFGPDGTFLNYVIAPGDVNSPVSLMLRNASQNVIGGNAGFGIVSSDVGTNNSVFENYIGVGSNGSALLPNSSGAIGIVSGATIRGTGSVNGGISNEGNLRLLNTTDTLAINGDYTQTSSGALNIQVKASDPAILRFDQLIVNGTVTLAGALNVTLDGVFGAQSPADQRLMLIDNRGNFPMDGHFAGLAEGGIVQLGNVNFRISYVGGDGNDLVLKSIGDNTPPTANAGGPYIVSEGGTVVLNAAGSSDAEQGNGTLIYEWDFDNDGLFDDAAGIAPTLSAVNLDGPIALTVTLRVTDNSGETSTATTQIQITNIAPTPTIVGAPTTIAEGTLISLIGNAIDRSQADTAAGFRFSWHVEASNGQTIADGTGPNFTFIPVDDGAYQVTLTTVDKDQGSASTTINISVTDVPPEVTIIGPSDGIMGQTLSFTLMTSDPSDIDQAAGFTYRIDWDGNGSVDEMVIGSGIKSVNHVFPEPGDYVARVTVQDVHGITSAESVLPIAIGWTRQFGSLAGTNDVITGTATDLNGNIFVVGSVSDSLPGQMTAGTYDAFIRKYDSAGVELWTRQFGSTMGDTARGVAVDASGAAYVVGDTSGALPGQTKTTGFEDAFISKFLSDGTLSWTRQFGSSATTGTFTYTGYTDRANAVAVDSTGVYIAGVVGASLPGQPAPQGTSGSAFVRKYTLEGAEIWTTQFGTNHSPTIATSVALDVTGKLYVVGNTNGTITGQTNLGSTDGFIRRYTINGSVGTIDWTKQFGTNSTDQVSGVAVDASGIYVAGYAGGALVTGQTRGAFVRKYLSDGSVSWTDQFGGNSSDFVAGIAVNVSGVYVAGVTAAQTTAGGQVFIQKYSGTGVMTWRSKISDPNSVLAASGIAIGSTGLYIGGRTEGRGLNVSSNGYVDATLYKYGFLGNEIWMRQINSIRGGEDSGKAIARDSIGNLYVAGTTTGALPSQFGHGQTADVFVRKYAVDGTLLWTRQFGTDWNDSIGDVVVDTQGAVYVAGTVSDALPGQTSSSGWDAFVRKYDSNGNEIWTRQFGTNKNDYVTGLAVDQSNALYLTGSTEGAFAGQTSAGGRDAFVRKLDSSGNVIWTRQFGTPSSDTGSQVAVDSLGQVYVAGGTSGALPGQVNSGDSDIFLRKFTTDGTIVWTKQFGSSQFDAAYGVAIDPVGGIYVAGTTYGQVTSTYVPGSLFVRRYKTNGDVDWTRQFGSSAGGDDAHDIAADGTGVYVAGHSSGLTGQPNPSNSEAFVRKYDITGGLAWTRQFGGGTYDSAEALVVAAPTEIYVLGNTNGALPGYSNLGGNYGLDTFIVQLRVSTVDPVATSQFDRVTISGTPGDDLIVLDPGSVAGTLHVTVNGTLLGVYSNIYVSSISVLAGFGNDSIVVNANAGTSVILDGQEGTDTHTVNLSRLSGQVTIADTGTTGLDRQVVNATTGNDYIDKRGDVVKWWVRSNSPESNPVNPPRPLVTVSGNGVERSTINLGSGNDFILDPSDETELIGGPGDDTFVITETFGNGVSIQDNEGSTEVVIYLGALGGPVVVDVEGVLGTANVTVIGTNDASSVEVSEDNITTDTGESISIVGIPQQTSIELGVYGGQVILNELGSSPTRYNIVADNAADLQVQVVGTPPLDLVVNNNHAPIASAGGPYTIGEGGSLMLDASLSVDSDEPGDTLTYSWDINGDGVFTDAAGVMPTLSWPSLSSLGIQDGSTSWPVRLRVDDGVNPPVEAVTTLTIDNVAPSAVMRNSGPVVQSGTVTVQFTDPTDPSPVDTASGFRYSFAKSYDALASTYIVASVSSSASFSWNVPGNHTVYGRIVDKDGGYRDYVTTVQVLAPTPVDVTSLVSFRYYGTQFNSRTKTYAFYGTVTNTSNQPILGPIQLGWANIFPSTAQPLSGTGTWADGTPYFDLSTLVGSDGVLSPGETSQPRTFSIRVVTPGSYSFTSRLVGIRVPVGEGEGQSLPLVAGNPGISIRSIKPEIIDAQDFVPLVHHNPQNGWDVNDDSLISPLDAWLIINHLNRNANQLLGSSQIMTPAGPYIDTNGDNVVSRLDVLQVIERLNQIVSGDDVDRGEGEEVLGDSTLLESQAADAFFAALDLETDQVLFQHRRGRKQ